MIGSFVSSKAGHDKGNIYVVVDEKGDEVFLCDGKYKLLDKPKRKKTKHIQPINIYIDSKALADLENNKITNEQIKYEIKQYVKNREQ